MNTQTCCLFSFSKLSKKHLYIVHIFYRTFLVLFFRHHLTTTVLFADVSGFTKMTERLNRLGDAGSEQLAHCINSYFERLGSVISFCGGDVFKFAGDALLVLWPSDDDDKKNNHNDNGDGDGNDGNHGNDVESILNAIDCALIIQEQFHNFQIYDDITLKVKLGIGYGECTVVHLGTQQNRTHDTLQYSSFGDAVLQAFEAETFCQPGQVIICNSVWKSMSNQQRLRYHCNPETFNGKFLSKQWMFGQIHRTTRSKPHDRISKQINLSKNSLKCMERIKLYVPSMVLNYCSYKQWISENRNVCIVFINVTLKLSDLGQEEETTALELLQSIVSYVQNSTYHHGGYLNKFSFDDKGSSFLLVFGLPPNTTAQDCSRAVLCALDIHQYLKLNFEKDFYQNNDNNGNSNNINNNNNSSHNHHPHHHPSLHCAIGINCGNAWCGVIGSTTNHEYGILGDVVNLAARLMQAAQIGSFGHIYCSEQVKHEASVTSNIYFIHDSLMQIKGKREAINVFSAHKRSLNEAYRIETRDFESLNDISNFAHDQYASLNSNNNCNDNYNNNSHNNSFNVKNNTSSFNNIYNELSTHQNSLIGRQRSFSASRSTQGVTQLQKQMSIRMIKNQNQNQIDSQHASNKTALTAAETDVQLNIFETNQDSHLTTNMGDIWDNKYIGDCIETVFRAMRNGKGSVQIIAGAFGSGKKIVLSRIQSLFRAQHNMHTIYARNIAYDNSKYSLWRMILLRLIENELRIFVENDQFTVVMKQFIQNVSESKIYEPRASQLPTFHENANGGRILSDNDSDSTETHDNYKDVPFFSKIHTHGLRLSDISFDENPTATLTLTDSKTDIITKSLSMTDGQYSTQTSQLPQPVPQRLQSDKKFDLTYSSQLVDKLPVLNSLLLKNFEETEFTLNCSDKERFNAIVELITHLLIQASKYFPLLLLLSDIQYQNDDDCYITQAICHLVRHSKIKNVHLVMTTTPQDHAAYKNYDTYLTASKFISNLCSKNKIDHQLKVVAWDRAETMMFLLTYFSTFSISSEMITFLMIKCAGYCGLIVNLLDCIHEKLIIGTGQLTSKNIENLIKSRNEHESYFECYENEILPVQAQRMFMQLLDTLSVEELITLKIAAIIAKGRGILNLQFHVLLLSSVLRSLNLFLSIGKIVENLIEKSFLVKVRKHEHELSDDSDHVSSEVIELDNNNNNDNRSAAAQRQRTQNIHVAIPDIICEFQCGLLLDTVYSTILFSTKYKVHKKIAISLQRKCDKLRTKINAQINQRALQIDNGNQVSNLASSNIQTDNASPGSNSASNNQKPVKNGIFSRILTKSYKRSSISYSSSAHSVLGPLPTNGNFGAKNRFDNSSKATEQERPLRRSNAMFINKDDTQSQTKSKHVLESQSKSDYGHKKSSIMENETFVRQLENYQQRHEYFADKAQISKFGMNITNANVNNTCTNNNLHTQHQQQQNSATTICSNNNNNNTNNDSNHNKKNNNNDNSNSNKDNNKNSNNNAQTEKHIEQTSNSSTQETSNHPSFLQRGSIQALRAKSALQHILSPFTSGSDGFKNPFQRASSTDRFSHISLPDSRHSMIGNFNNITKQDSETIDQSFEVDRLWQQRHSVSESSKTNMSASILSPLPNAHSAQRNNKLPFEGVMVLFILKAEHIPSYVPTFVAKTNLNFNIKLSGVNGKTRAKTVTVSGDSHASFYQYLPIKVTVQYYCFLFSFYLLN